MNKMSVKRLLPIALAALLGVMTTSCLKDGEETIGLPVAPDNLLSDQMKAAIEEHMPLYGGEFPPEVAGEYLMDPQEAVYFTEGTYTPDGGWTALYFAFSSTTDNKVRYIERQGLAYSYADEVQLEGMGDYFTAYCTKTGYYDETMEESYTAVLVISGHKTKDGVENMHYAVCLPDGRYRVFKDGDGLAEDYSWIYEE